MYGWNISYTISYDGTEVASGVLNKCTVGLEDLLLRPFGGPSPTGAACIQETLVPGQYTIDMVLVMNDKPSENPASWN